MDKEDNILYIMPEQQPQTKIVGALAGPSVPSKVIV